MALRKRTLKESSYSRLGLLLAFIGTLLAIDTMTDITFFYKLWPLLITTLGIGFIGIYIHRSRREAIYIGVGVYAIGFSVLALYCSLTTWTTLGIHWPVFIGLLGLSFVFSYFFGRCRPTLLLVGFLFISLSILFYFVFGLNQKLWWSIFILTGISLIIFDKMRRQ